MLSAAAAASAAALFPAASELTAPTNAFANLPPNVVTNTTLSAYPGAYLGGVSCSGAGSCAAVGQYLTTSGAAQAMAATESAGSWAQAGEVAAPAGAASSPDAGLLGISCSSSANCTAVGNYEDGSGNTQAMAAIESAASWEQSVEVAAPSNAGPNPSASLNAVSCSSAGNCAAVGSYQDSSGKHQAMAAVETAGSWAQAVEVAAPSGSATDPIATLDGVSCWSAGNCTAVGSYQHTKGVSQAMAASESAGSWPEAIKVAASPGASLVGVSCWSAAACTAVGQYIDSSGSYQAMAATQSGGSWGRPAEISSPPDALPTPHGFLDGVSCSSAGTCTATGGYVNIYGNDLAMDATESAGAWAEASQVSALPSNVGGNPNAYLDAVSCWGAELCAAVGQYQDDSNFTWGMVASSVPSLALTTTSLPAATVGKPYSSSLGASGGIDYTYTIASGSLPGGLSLNPSTGAITGTPTAVSRTRITFRVTEPGPPSEHAGASLWFLVTGVTPPRSTRPQAIIRSRTVALVAASDAVPIAISCEDAHCAGTIRMTERRAKTVVLLATAAYRVATGTSRTVDLRPTPAGLTALGTASSARLLQVTLTATVKGGLTTTTHAVAR